MYVSVSDFKFILYVSNNFDIFVYLVFCKTTYMPLLENRCKGYFEYDTNLLNEITLDHMVKNMRIVTLCFYTEQ